MKPQLFHVLSQIPGIDSHLSGWPEDLRPLVVCDGVVMGVLEASGHIRLRLWGQPHRSGLPAVA